MVIDRTVFQAVNRSMDCFHDCVKTFLVLPVRVYVEPYADRIAFQGPPKDGSIFRCSPQSIILGQGILFPKTCRGTDHFHHRILWGSKKILRKWAGVQKF